MSRTAPVRAVAAAVALAIAPAAAVLADSPALMMIPLDSIATGGAEIGAYDPFTRRIFVTNAAAQTVTIVNARDPANLATVGTIDVSAFGSPNSVAVSRGIVAVAIEADPKTVPGRIGFYTLDGRLLTTVKVGALPDMLTFTPDGQFLVVANEGEPDDYGPAGTDPEGTVSIVRMPFGAWGVKRLRDSDVRTADFRQFNGQEDALRARGIRIYGPGASAAMDFEPEYITVSSDSRTAYVTLQENNAVAKIDIWKAKVTDLLPLGYKDQNAAPFATATYEWPDAELPSIGTTPGGQSLKLGGFSGLAYEGVTPDGRLKFIANTDRGPNGEPNAAGQRPFLLPQFSPELVRFTVDPSNGRFTLQQRIALRNADGSPLTGLPNTAVVGGTANTPHNDEVPVDLNGNVLALDRLGGDFEGIVVADDGSFWLPDEYRPAIYHFDTEGRLLERYIPIGGHAAEGLPVPAAGAAGALGIEALPGVLGQRRQNRGMEALALAGGKLYGFVQSPLRNPVSLSNGTLNGLRNIRVVEFDPATLATRQFIYILDNPLAVSADDSRADKIGDAVAVPGGFLAVERDDDALPEDALETISKKVYGFSLAGATDISGVDTIYEIAGVQKSLDQMSAAELASVGVAPLAKTLQVDLADAGYASVEKVEGLALIGDGRLAFVNDNDFGVAQIVIDNASGIFTTAPGYVPEPVVLGIVDVPGLDASDRDSLINIRPWPVFGMYQPDAIASYRVGGRTLLVTANEGDAREYDSFEEEARIGSSSVVLDPVAFPDAAVLKQNANLGRLNITTALGDTDGDGDLDALYTLGGRSFSIWSTAGELVYDSGSALERITAAAFPATFNASNADNSFDSRSDNKGPEPEGLDVGSIAGRQYAFVGLERIGGIVAYDITNPESPVFVDYVNNRDFALPADGSVAEAGDLGPEGVLFVPGILAPKFEPLLIVTNEISGTLTTYALDVCDARRVKARRYGWFYPKFGRQSRCER